MAERDVDPTYEGMSKTTKGPAYFPGSVEHGARGDCADMKGSPGSGTQNLSPPNARSMGGAMEGSGLPPADGIKLGIAPQYPPPLPPGPDVDGPCPMPTMGEAALPPGPPIGAHSVGVPGALPPGVPVGEEPKANRYGGSKAGGRGHGGGSGGGQLPPGVSV